MNEKREYGILWRKWLGGFATVVWIVGTYFGLLAVIVVMGTASGKGTLRPELTGAVAGVLLASLLHWMLFSMIEHGHIKRMNENEKSGA